MVDEKQKPKSGGGPGRSRELARAEALRANLKRRKVQAQSRSPAADSKDAPRRGGA